MSTLRVLTSLLIFASVSSSSFAGPAATRTSSMMLNSGWEFRQRMEGPATPQPEWRPAEVPGVVHLDLLRNHLIPDPFYRENEAKLQWIENASWEYRHAVEATPEILRHENVDLVFEGLDTY